MNNKESINEYKESRTLQFNLTGQSKSGYKTLDEISKEIRQLGAEIDNWIKNANS